jgi:hypothetical protein
MVSIYNRAVNPVKNGVRARFLAVTAALLALATPSPAGPGQGADCGAPELICKASYNQGISAYVRDRCRYEQRLLMERYKYDKRAQQTGELLAKRQTTVVVEPAPEPDETGQIPVVTRVVADTNDKGEPKEKVDPSARTGLTSGPFLDEVFFPLVPENVRYLEFEEVPSKTDGERWFIFAPKLGVTLPDRPLAKGLVQLDANTGEVLTMRIDGFANLRALDKHLEKILSFKADIDYSQFGGRYRMPVAANGSGVSDVSRFQGYFRFIFEEGKYAPVMKIE